MQQIYNSILLSAQAASPDAVQGDVMISNSFLEISGVIVCTAGICLLITWLFWHDGFSALKKAPIRRCHRYFPFFVISFFLLWVLMMGAASGIVNQITINRPKADQEMVNYVTLAAMQTGFIVQILYCTRYVICRRLKGFGLNFSTFIPDISMATINLIAIFPLTTLASIIVVQAGTWLNPDFSPQVHDTLNTLTQAGMGLKILIFVSAGIIVPIFEELLFRGMVQTSIRSYIGNPWASIIFTSLVFTFMHWPNYTHMPILFILSCGMGYAYERSGSLFRPIVMHVLFNLVNITATLFMT